MSDTTQEAVRRVREDSPTVVAVCRTIERQSDSDSTARIVDFAGIFLSKAPPGFLHQRSTDTLAQVVCGAFRFLERSRPDRVDVEVVNPDVDDEGWYAPVTVIRTNLSERPFIVDTIRECLHEQDLPIEHNVYPVLRVDRDREGRVLTVLPSREGGSRESLVHCEVPRVADAEMRAALRSELERRLNDVLRATDDFGVMIEALEATARELAARAPVLPDRRAEIDEADAFLRWLEDGAFVFLGYRGYDIVERGGERCVVVEANSGRGVLRDEAASRFATAVPVERLPEGVRRLVEGGPLLIVSKTNAESTVHRRARMDYVGVKKIAPDGAVVGERRFVGLFTSKAFGEPADQIPILRGKLGQILEEAGAREGTHDFKEINKIFNSMPKEELFLSSAEEIVGEVRTALTSYHSEDVRVSLRRDPLRRGVSVMVILPRDRFSSDVRRRIGSALREAFRGEVLNYRLALGSGDQARLHFFMSSAPERLTGVQAGPLEATFRELIRSWQDRVREGLERVRAPDEARRLIHLYGGAFSPEYEAASAPAEAVRDILELEAMRSEGREVGVAISNTDVCPAAPGERVTELKLYLAGERLVLSDFMPILEDCGLRVIGVSPFDIGGEDVPRATIQAFAVQDAVGRPLDVDGGGTLLGQTVLAARAGDATSDRLNALVLAAGLHWREVDVLRAYAGYAFQLRAVPSRLSIPGALTRHPELARALVAWFRARFAPAVGLGSEEHREADTQARRSFQEGMADVGSLADDRALRVMAQLLDASLRTNYFRHGGRTPTTRSGGVPYISIKFDARRFETIQRSRLLYEIYVHSARMEGVHLRGASVARGGIRWSDRPDDYRTEILGLVKTQMVKNAVIGPGGSKGGFVLKRPPAGSREGSDEGREQYRTLIRGLLDLTDSLDREGSTVPPDNVVCWDRADPYLVVAADKGTARFSDEANALAEDYEFWLGDAFASGGSHGYDHKVVGITARGAWECVKRHFRERGKDIQEEPFSVVGIGDMSGDVFGNGMLLSRKIRLLAAFDHRHVFLDPDPDPDASYRERARLFSSQGSSWDDYDRSVLSEGAAIVPRSAKQVELSPQAKEALGLAESSAPMDGEALVRAVLRAPVELLWNGGIGTYVKASFEGHADAGDPANDAVRVSADELRCAVVGEGGNLGLTQAARVEWALRGGRVNTDALDNSGGVDLSDREVNLKILLGPAVASGALDERRRNALLGELTDSVAELVLRDNRSQSLAVSLDEVRTASSADDYAELLGGLERQGILDRRASGLPSQEELVERADRAQSLTRPELCVLLAYAKLAVKPRLLESALPDDPALEGYLLGYFPREAVRAAGAARLAGHRLRREVITSQVANQVVDIMGATFLHRLTRDTGREVHEVVKAWLIAARLAGHDDVLRQLTSATRPLRTADEYRWLLGLGRVLERTTRWVLRNVDPETPVLDPITREAGGLHRLREEFHAFVSGPDRELFEGRVAELMRAGADRTRARSVITLRFLDQLLEILHIAGEVGSDPVQAGDVFYRVSESMRLSWLREAIQDSASDDRWERRAARALTDDLGRAHHKLVVEGMRKGEFGSALDASFERLWVGGASDAERFRALVDEVRSEDPPSVSGLSVAVRELAALAERASR